ncbi:MAG: hypothetical protein ACE145_11775 [Terriglobia bacterium]
MLSRCILSSIMIAGLGVLPLLAADGPDWDPWRFLLGEWVGEGEGQPGQGIGKFSFALDLQGRILVRKNRADYPATRERPAYSHEDLMVIYQGPSPSSTRAIYFDNEGHVIQYRVTVSTDGNSVTFLSDPSPSAPRFRLTYTKGKSGGLKILFEIAPPGKPDVFSPYIEATASRRK